MELTQANIVSQVHATISTFCSAAGTDVCLSVLPPEHIFERMTLCFYISSGLPVYFVDDPKRLVERMKEVRPTVIAVVRDP